MEPVYSVLRQAYYEAIIAENAKLKQEVEQLQEQLAKETIVLTQAQLRWVGWHAEDIVIARLLHALDDTSRPPKELYEAQINVRLTPEQYKQMNKAINSQMAQEVMQLQQKCVHLQQKLSMLEATGSSSNGHEDANTSRPVWWKRLLNFHR